jgi:hypothetical protein
MKNRWMMGAVCLGILAFFYWAVQQDRLPGILPYLILLLCPLLHLLMHRRRGGRIGHGQDSEGRDGT